MPVEPFALERFFAKHEFTTPHLLGVSDCESMSVGELLELEPGAEDRLRELRLGYTESDGSPTLRAALAATYGSNPVALAADDILVHAAGVEVIFALSHALLRPGDHAIVQTPCYQILRSAPEMAGAAVSPWPMRPEAGWAPDLDELVGLIRDDTRLIVVNTPHNPTGHHLSREVLETILRLAEDRGIVVLVDEAYRGTEYDEADRLPSAAQLSESAAALGLLSKGYGLPGLRVGWLATRNRRVQEAVRIFKDYTTICSPAPSEFLGEIAARHSPLLLARARARARENLDRLRDVLHRWPGLFDWVEPMAGPITFPRLRRGSAREFADRLREEAGVLVVPGTLFDAGDDAIRVGFGRASFPEGLERLDQWLNAGGAR